MARAKVKWEWNIAGFAQLRSDPALVNEMAGAMVSAAAGTPFEVEVWSHVGRRTGPRTSVQAWARSREAMAEVQRDPGSLLAVLHRTGLQVTEKKIYVTKAGKVRTATQAQIDNWTRGRRDG